MVLTMIQEQETHTQAHTHLFLQKETHKEITTC